MSSPASVNEQNQATGDMPYCDLIMKGGITSGVVYPLAICELASKYRLKNIGGASAGAIAAGLAAAAEYGREKNGFQRLAGIAAEVSERLLSLFQPVRGLKPLFGLLLTCLGQNRRTITTGVVMLIVLTVALVWSGFARHAWIFQGIAILLLLDVWVLGGVAMGLWICFLLASIPGVALAVWVTLHGNGLVSWLAALLLWLVGLVAGFGLRFWWMLTRGLPRHNFGICSGMRAPGSHTPALTEWLADKIDEVAGLKEENPEKPLTFGDLRGDGPNGQDWINLEIMTTNLTTGRPFRMPFTSQIFWFHEADMRKLFPERIVNWMVKHSEDMGTGYRTMPQTPDLPVVVAVRMSLSFPFLLGAVPLYARDFTRKEEGERQKPRKCWFSDGGICSNFPIHFFDSIWPRWPTFGIVLETFHPDYPDSTVWLPTKPGEGILRRFVPIESLGGFVGSLIDTLQEWQDILQSELPGYRTRIVHVRLTKQEGGLNLNMPPTTVRKLSGRGQEAGQKLVEDFNWDGHRWIRYVTTMAKLESTLGAMYIAYTAEPPGGESFQDFLERHSNAPEYYRQSDQWLNAARQAVGDLMEDAGQWDGVLNKGDIPRPDVDLRITPKV